MITLKNIVLLVEGKLIQGDPQKKIQGVGSLQEATSTDISFFNDQRYREDLLQTAAGAILITPETDLKGIEAACISVPNPSAALDRIIQQLYSKETSTAQGIHPTALVDPSATLGKNVHLGPYVVIEAGVTIGTNTTIGAHSFIGAESQVGSDTLLYPHVTIREKSLLGNKVILHSGVVIGSCGFGYATEKGVHHKIPQVGIVVIEDDVEIGANTTIDRARFGKTIIGHGSKIDNLVQIAHNVKIGPHNIICSQVGISGSTSTGAYVTLAGQVGVSGHIDIEDQVTVGAQSGVSKKISKGEIVIGSPVKPIREWKKNLFYLNNLSKLFGRVKSLEKEIQKILEVSS